MKTFTIEGQQGNRITRTTKQIVKHNLYSNNEVIICGLDKLHTVWLRQGHRMMQKADKLRLVDAIDFANNIIRNI